MQGYEKEPDMCEAFDRIKIREREERRLQAQRECAADLRKREWSDEDIAARLKVDVVDVKIWLDFESQLD